MIRLSTPNSNSGNDIFENLITKNLSISLQPNSINSFSHSHKLANNTSFLIYSDCSDYFLTTRSRAHYYTAAPSEPCAIPQKQAKNKCGIFSGSTS